MRQLFTKISLFAAAAAISCSCSNLPSSDEVMDITRKVADWQIENFDNQADFRAPRATIRAQDFLKSHDLVWQNAAFYSGLYELSTVTDDAKYINWLEDMGDRHEWKLYKRLFHADDHAVGQFYMNMAKQYDKDYMWEPTRDRFEEVLSEEEDGQWHWTWCDALYMAPPVWVRLSEISGDPKYLDFMDEQYHMSYDILWDKEEHLFYRDKRFFTMSEKNGEKVFWARGNGWVFGGLALMIPDFPEGWEGTEFYIEIFKEMAAKLKEIQRPDGTWSSGLLGDLADYECIETSGTSFFTYGFAWGINNGILDRETYEPVLLKGWNALVDAVNEDGMLTYVQGVGARPGNSLPIYTEVYGSGAFVTAGAEMYKYVQKFGK